jgi:hypothetical protein
MKEFCFRGFFLKKFGKKKSPNLDLDAIASYSTNLRRIL